MGTACLDVCEDVSSGEQAPRPSPLTPIISAKSPLRLAKTLKKQMRGPNPAVSSVFFMFFAAVRAEFWQNRDVLAGCARARSQAQDGRTTRQVDRPQPSQAGF